MKPTMTLEQFEQHLEDNELTLHGDEFEEYKSDLIEELKEKSKYINEMEDLLVVSAYEDGANDIMLNYHTVSSQGEFRFIFAYAARHEKFTVSLVRGHEEITEITRNKYHI